jgi:hypothetical protein
MKPANCSGAPAILSVCSAFLVGELFDEEFCDEFLAVLFMELECFKAVNSGMSSTLF